MIREVIPSTDSKQIAEIYNKYIEKTTVSFETEPLSVVAMQIRVREISSEYPYYVYMEDDKIIGYAYAHKWKERAAYRNTLETSIYVDSSCRNHGIGKKLMSHLIGECRKRNVHVLIACITANNVESINFHKSLGFAEVSHFYNVGEKFGEKLDIIDMEMQL